MKRATAALWASFFLLFSSVLFCERWGPTLIMTHDLATQSKVAMDSQGNSLAIWEYEEGILRNGTPKRKIASAILPVNGAEWIVLKPFYLRRHDSCFNPQVAMDRMGNGIAVWDDFDSVTNQYFVQYAALPAGLTKWSTPLRISSSGSLQPTYPQIAVDGQSNSFVVWQKNLGQQTIIQAAVVPFLAKNIPLNTDLTAPTEQGFFPVLAANESGDAIVVWEGVDEGFLDTKIGSSFYEKETQNWMPIDVTHFTKARGARAPQVVLDPFGHAVVIFFEQQPNGFSLIRASKMLFHSGYWKATGNLPTINLNRVKETPRIGVDRAGNATALWQNFDGGTSSFVEAATLPSHSWNWVDVKKISASINDAEEIALSVLPDGNAYAVWTRQQPDKVQGARYNVHSKTWSTPSFVPSVVLSASQSCFPTIVSNERGQVLTAWRGSDQTIQSNFFSLTPVNPPQNLAVVQLESQSLHQAYYTHQITWSPPIAGNRPTLFKIFRDVNLSQQIGTVFFGQPLVLNDTNRQKGESYSYYIISVDAGGNASAPANVTLSGS